MTIDTFDYVAGDLATVSGGVWVNRKPGASNILVDGTDHNLKTFSQANAIYSRGGFGNDHSSTVQIVKQDDPVNFLVGTAVRCFDDSCYALSYSPSYGGYVRISKLGPGSAGTIGDAPATDFAIGDYLRLSIVGTTLRRFYAKQSAPTVWIELGTPIDDTAAPYMTGDPGIWMYDHELPPAGSGQSSCRIDNWEGLTVVAPTTPTITNLSDSTLDNGQAGVIVTGTNFDSAGVILISPTNNPADAGAITQSETGTRIATQATFTAVKGSLPTGTGLFLFVKNESGTFNTTGRAVQFNSTQVKVLKVLIDSASIGAVVDGIVWQAQGGGAIAGPEVGEFTGLTIVAGTGADAGKGVLKIPTSAFDSGDVLAAGAAPIVYLKNATYFTDAFPGSVILE